jgi:hypothetical protein
MSTANTNKVRESQNSLPCSAAQVRDAQLKRLVAMKTNQRIFENLETRKDDRKENRLQQSRIDERRISPPGSEVKASRKEHHFCQCQRIDERETMIGKIDVMFGQNHGLVHDQKSEYSPEIKCDDEAFLRFLKGSLLEAPSHFVHGRSLLGTIAMLTPDVEMQQPFELIAFSILGIVGGVASVAFASGIGTLRPRCRELPNWTQYFQPAVAGLYCRW